MNSTINSNDALIFENLENDGEKNSRFPFAPLQN